jgi:hypothetical protein
MGPFTKQDVSLGVFAHNAAPLRIGKDYYIFHIGTANSSSYHNCSTTASEAAMWAQLQSPSRPSPANGSGFLHKSASPTGPWQSMPSLSGCINPGARTALNISRRRTLTRGQRR